MKSSLLAELLEPGGMEILLQPIFEIAGHGIAIHGIEFLLHGPRGTRFESQAMLLEYVRRKRAEAMVDRYCFRAICEAARELPRHTRLHINIHASTLAQNPGFVPYMRIQAEHHDLHIDRVTVELVDYNPNSNQHNLLQSLRGLRDLGVRIALDDLGLVNSNYRLLSECSPDYLKLDSFLTQRVRTNANRWAIVESVITLSHALRSRLVATEVASRQDYSALAQMGITLAQADFLCRSISVGSLLGSGLLNMGIPASSEGARATAGESGKQASHVVALHARGACFAD